MPRAVNEVERECRALRSVLGDKVVVVLEFGSLNSVPVVDVCDFECWKRHWNICLRLVGHGKQGRKNVTSRDFNKVRSQSVLCCLLRCFVLKSRKQRHLRAWLRTDFSHFLFHLERKSALYLAQRKHEPQLSSWGLELSVMQRPQLRFT